MTELYLPLRKKKKMNDENYESRRSKEIVIDTGPLLILLSGLYGHGVEKFAKEKNDFNVLKKWTDNSNIFVTPQVLAEVSNLAKREFRGFFEDFINYSTNTIMILDEIYVEKNILATKPELKLAKFGFTDSSLIGAAMNGKMLLTTDISLYHYCMNIGIAAMTIDAIKYFYFGVPTKGR